jgi:uncharacterized coiled-coil protein SlyX
MIAQDVTKRQAELCAERRGRIDDRLTTLTAATAENTRAIAELSKSVVTVAAVVTQLTAAAARQSSELAEQRIKLADHSTKLATMKIQVSIAAVIGGSLPLIAQWIIQSVNP